MILATNVEIKNKMLVASNKEQLTAIRTEYGNEEVSFVWSRLSSDEKEHIRQICCQKDFPEETIFALAKRVKNIRNLIIAEMAKLDRKTLKDDNSKVVLKSFKNGEYSVSIS